MWLSHNGPSCSMLSHTNSILNTFSLSILAFALLNVIFFDCVWAESCTEFLWHITYCYRPSVHEDVSQSLFPFLSRYPSIAILFLLPNVYVLCLYTYVRYMQCVCVPVHAHIIVRHGIISAVHWLKWYPELRHQTPEASWVMVHRSAARTKGAMVKGMEIVEERDRWSRQKTSSPGSAADSVWGLRLWGFCQSGSGGKVAPWRERAESERGRDARGCVGH